MKICIRRTVSSLVDKELVLTNVQKEKTIYMVYDVFFMHWLAREY